MSAADAARVQGSTIMTASGRYVDPLDLRPDDVCIEDIAHALGNQCRYSGHTREFYSVAQHSFIVAEVLADRGANAETVLWGLLHDAAEAYLVDLPRPLKRHEVFGAIYRDTEDRVLAAVLTHFGLDHVEPPAVKLVDLILLATERRDLMPAGGDWAVLDGVTPLVGVIDPWPPSVARARFMDAFELLTSRARLRALSGGCAAQDET